MKQELIEILADLGFAQAKGQPLLFQKGIDLETNLYVDFRKNKDKGRRFVKQGDSLDVDPDMFPDLVLFKERRDALLQSSASDTKDDQGQGDPNDGKPRSPAVGQETFLNHTTTPTQEPNSSPAPIFDYIKDIVGDDILELFGDTGTGKSKFIHALALEAIASGKKVYFLDTERNLSKADVALLGNCYRYTPVFNEIKQLTIYQDSHKCKNPDCPNDLGQNRIGRIPKVDLLIIDSVGLPILTRFATLSMKEKGNALLDLIAVVGNLKEWAYKNNAMAIITNQPESEFGKDKDEIRKPFGDKACFAAKEIWLTRKLKATNMTKCSVESFRSRSMKSGLNILQIEITDQGTKIVR